MNKGQPLIGITSDYHKQGDIFRGPAYFIGENYVSAVREAGGAPVILPYISEKSILKGLLQKIDGILITGGDFDINPSFYGEKPIDKTGNFNVKRTDFEMEIARIGMNTDAPILGICGGEQLINVAGGGSLYQDIGSQVETAFDHQQKTPKYNPFHSVVIKSDTKLHSILGCNTIDVNSTHHQSIKKTGDGFIVNAMAEDGIVEGIESIHHRFVLGIQWHPEFLYPKERCFRRLFETFVASCGE